MSIKLLNKHAPIKMKYKRGNHMPFITKDLSKEIMKRLKLRNNYLKNKTDTNRMLYKKQSNCCVSLLRKSKTNYYANLDEKKMPNNKLFWKVIKLLLLDKSCQRANQFGRKRGNFKNRFRNSRSFKYFLWKHSKKS